MRKRQTLRMLRRTFKIAGADKIIGGYLASFFILAVPVWLVEPNIKSYFDSLWFCFASATSIGYGDLTAVTLLGRIATVVLSVYSIAVIAIFTAVITGFFMDMARLRAAESAGVFLDELEHLPELSKEELAELSKRAKVFQKNFYSDNVKQKDRK